MSQALDDDLDSDRHINRKLSVLMGAEAAVVAVVAGVHLSGNTPTGPTQPFQALGTGISESVIALALALATVALVRSLSPARSGALAATSFAIFGFAVGLVFTVLGDTPDLVFHAVMLPVFLLTLVVLLYLGNESVGPQPPSQSPN